MPKTIDYPRTSYLGAWEAAEVVDDTGGKCSVEACARKLNRKVSGSFKAILGSAVKFGLLTSKRELLTTTNLFRRIKHAYDKQEEKIFHREAFLHPPLFTHICRKFRNRELPVHMFDVMLVREFGVEEINAQSVAKAFLDGARMVDVIDERNIIADIDKLAQAIPRRDVASPEMPVNLFPTQNPSTAVVLPVVPAVTSAVLPDAVSSLFGLTPTQATDTTPPAQTHIPAERPAETGSRAHTITKPADQLPQSGISTTRPIYQAAPATMDYIRAESQSLNTATEPATHYTIHISGPGIDSQLAVQDRADLNIVSALLEKIRKQLPE
ncbi:hypothetical protein [Hymenobacter koreensis]|uniref:Uncharacterized protein n=1 Tax=Hymenobacter koreensis TaxID=1084523 RepID=A0ABP8J781_9BACT